MSSETVNVDEFQEIAKQSLPKLYYDYYASLVDRGTDVFKALAHATQALLAKISSDPVKVEDFKELAKLALPKVYYDFYAGGAEDEHTLRDNIQAFQRITIRPRVLVDVSQIDTSTTILGYLISSPILVAPTAAHKLAFPEGELATARAAAAAKTIMVLSFSSTFSIEEVASSCNAVRFFQLYIFKRRDVSRQLLQRAERYGYKAVVLTVDSPRLGRREHDIKNKMIAVPEKNLEGLVTIDVTSDQGSQFESFANKTLDASLRWEDIQWLKSITTLPILIKGILTHEDATKAVEAGVDGIIVSNHGARQLDFAPATVTVLEEVVHAVKGKVPVLLDGGVRRGTDVFKALALGAQAVLIGRPVLYGLAAKGEEGVRTVLEMLKNELETSMALSGCPSIKDITRSHVRMQCDKLHSML
ncbi:peroxisomal (S)-2-hydroxy-acid oxidase GLO4-like [Cucumis melo var. makuwa]|uniref:(S)-2-hydroxy-acid oxidase n=1 Tax=Cucumis melo var. makuwa TaxID=1194695 RepID=A0A5A7UJ62_CUCMM|nr:peroxisomal (S)-2-hydroxy-acid oxidase GLO4-like [Cucumis melo var. makuwa]TYK19116.1 peroxisomal (S)-2-hydroxy-acid oxidase GLO4-like [Cucumis melo var. makuwa]